jgi:hypothetical protein
VAPVETVSPGLRKRLKELSAESGGGREEIIAGGLSRRRGIFDYALKIDGRLDSLE